MRKAYTKLRQYSFATELDDAGGRERSEQLREAVSQILSTKEPVIGKLEKALREEERMRFGSDELQYEESRLNYSERNLSRTHTARKLVFQSGFTGRSNTKSLIPMDSSLMHGSRHNRSPLEAQ